jgi:serine/threonine-protein kinase RsbW
MLDHHQSRDKHGRRGAVRHNGASTVEHRRRQSGDPGGEAGGDTAIPPVRFTIPADKDHLVLVRSVAAHMGARLGFSIPDVDDFRLAVNEACCLFLTSEEPAGGTLDCAFAEAPDAVTVTVSAPVPGDSTGRQVGSFGWMLLESLVDGLWWTGGPGRAEVRLVKRRPADDS